MDFTETDTNAVLNESCKTMAGVVIDLTNYTVTLRWRYTPNGPMTEQATMVKANQTTNPGEVYYRWTAGQLIAPNIIYDMIIVETASGRFVTQADEVVLSIRSKAESGGASPSPSASPSGSPSHSPSASPSSSRSASPSLSPSPSASPSASPSSSRSSSPSASPSAS